jgi:cytochrome c553
VDRNSRNSGNTKTARLWERLRGAKAQAVLFSGLLLGSLGLGLVVVSENSEPPVRVPSEVAWTDETLAFVSGGDSFRGLLLARTCNHCHGEEGFSAAPEIPNLAGDYVLSIWKQLEDFRSKKRDSPIMQRIVSRLSRQDEADLAAYFSALPRVSDPQDKRSFPQPMLDPSRSAMAARLIVLGDGERGIPPCQTCHGPVSYVRGAPSLTTQNGAYLQTQLEHFVNGSRANDINVRMRSIAKQLLPVEQMAVSQYYGAGLAPGENSRQ